MGDFLSFVKEDRMLRKGWPGKGHWVGGDRIPADDPGKRGPAYQMTAVLGARNAGFRSARTKRGGERVEKDTAPRRSNDRWP